MTDGSSEGALVPSSTVPDGLAALERFIVDDASIRVAVAFVTDAGVDHLRALLAGRTGVSLEVVARAADVTSPKAIEALRDELGATVSIVIGRHASAFHPKLWLIETHDRLTVLSGSGNLTSTGLRGNDEQFELMSMPADSAEAEAQRQRLENLIAHAVPLDLVHGQAIWKEWLTVYARQAKARREMLDHGRHLAKRDPRPNRTADIATLLEDLLDLYDRTVAAKLPTSSGRAYVPSRFKQALNRCSNGADPVLLVTRMCRQSSGGFDVLLANKRADLTVEQLVLDATKPYHDLFKGQTRELSAARLQAFEDVATESNVPTTAHGDFFSQSEELSPTRLVPLLIDAGLDLGRRATRDELVAAAIRIGRFTATELAVPSHGLRESEHGWGAVEGRLQYSIWRARDQGAFLVGEADGLQTLTDAGAARRGERTGYAALDARRESIQDANA